jgi:hypothetical protein
MGCDIHVYPEYASGSRQDGSDYWNLACDSFELGRDYKLFGLMAGVRREGQLFPKKGLPTDVSLSVKWKNELFVVEGEGEGEGTCSRASAEKWGGYVDGKKDRVFHPDWHSHSWLTLDELKAVEKAYTAENGTNYMLRSLIAMLSALDAAGKKTRVVFWFDN